MDFIIKLLKLENISIEVKYNSILIVVDKFIKYIYLIFCNKKFTVKQTVYIVLDKVIKYHRILKNITSNRNKIFKNNF